MAVQFISAVWGMFFAWMPLSLQIVFFSFVAIAMLILVIKIIGMVLNAIPFV